MTDDPRLDELTGDELLAAELALGLLEGEDLLAARGRMARDAAFATLVVNWDERLAPLLDQISGVEPSTAVWPRIEREVDARANAHARRRE